ncbi:MAG: MFS transporter [Chloroflexi bacterium]|nr:MFS transporter [Chloroflexota bacterium]
MAERVETPTGTGVAPPPGAGGRFQTLANRDFRLLLTGNVGSQLAMWSQQLGVGWLVFELTGSFFLLSTVFAVTGVTMIVFAPWGGVLADRYDRRKIMYTTQSVMAIVALVLAVLTMSDAIRVWMLYPLVAVLAMFFALGTPSRQAIVPDLVPKDQLMQAISMTSVTMNVMRILGPALGGVLLTVVGVEGAFFMQTAGFAWSATLASRISKGNTVTSGEFLQSMIEGVQYARRKPDIRRLFFIAAAFTVLALSYNQLMAAYASDVLDLGGGGFGLLMTAAGAGAFGSAVFLVFSNDSWSKGRVLLFSMVISGILLMGLGIFGHAAVAFPLQVALGLTTGLSMTLANILLQIIVDDQYRGRVMSLYFLTFGLQPLGSLPAGAAAEFVGLQVTFAVQGAILVAVSLWLLVSSTSIRRL